MDFSNRQMMEDEMSRFEDEISGVAPPPPPGVIQTTVSHPMTIAAATYTTIQQKMMAAAAGGPVQPSLQIEHTYTPSAAAPVMPPNRFSLPSFIPQQLRHRPPFPMPMFRPPGFPMPGPGGRAPPPPPPMAAAIAARSLRPPPTASPAGPLTTASAVILKAPQINKPTSANGSSVANVTYSSSPVVSNSSADTHKPDQGPDAKKSRTDVISATAVPTKPAVPLPAVIQQAQRDKEKQTAQQQQQQQQPAQQQQNAQKQPKKLKALREKRPKRYVRAAGGESWEDPTLLEWDPDDFRLFCGDLGNEVTDETLARVFGKYPSFQKSRVIRDKRTNKTKGFGFVSFKDAGDFVKAMREMNGKYVGNRPIKLRKSCWQDRNIQEVRKKQVQKQLLGFR